MRVWTVGRMHRGWAWVMVAALGLGACAENAEKAVGCADKVVACTAPAQGACPAETASTAPAPVTADRPCTWCPQPSPPGCTLCVSDNPLLVTAADGSASGQLQLCNRGTQPTTLALRVSDFHAVGPEGKPIPLAAATKLTGASPTDELIASGATPLAAGSCVALTVGASNLLQAGPLTATLRQGADSIVDLKAVHQPMPFGLKLDGPSGDKLELLFVKDGPCRAIRLRNEDTAVYRFRWRLELESVDNQASHMTVAQNAMREAKRSESLS